MFERRLSHPPGSLTREPDPSVLAQAWGQDTFAVGVRA